MLGHVGYKAKQEVVRLISKSLIGSVSEGIFEFHTSLEGGEASGKKHRKEREREIMIWI
jgi:hypothetical protein